MQDMQTHYNEQNRIATVLPITGNYSHDTTTSHWQHVFIRRLCESATVLDHLERLACVQLLASGNSLLLFYLQSDDEVEI